MHNKLVGKWKEPGTIFVEGSINLTDLFYAWFLWPPIQPPPKGFAAHPAVQALMSQPNPLTLEEIIDAWDGMFELDEERPSPKKEKTKRAYEQLFAPKHQYEVEVDVDVSTASDQMRRGAVLTSEEMKHGFCRICKEKSWPDDNFLTMDKELDLLVRIRCGCVFQKECITNGLLSSLCWPLCSYQCEKEYQKPLTVPLSWDGTDEDADGAIAPSDGSAGGVPPQDDAAGGPPPAPAGVAGAVRPDWIRRMLQSS